MYSVFIFSFAYISKTNKRFEHKNKGPNAANRIKQEAQGSQSDQAGGGLSFLFSCGMNGGKFKSKRQTPTRHSY